MVKIYWMFTKRHEVKALVKKSVAELYSVLTFCLLDTTMHIMAMRCEHEKYLADIFTVTANIVGCPAISLPSGLTSNNLPLGVQLMAPHMSENILFEIGKKFLGE